MEQIKLVLFDLDGVLIDAKEIHYLALNKALGPEFEISRQAFKASSHQRV
jgi:beta-phosphoglucomutase-like phosphatase (HAD superfamily)